MDHDDVQVEDQRFEDDEDGHGNEVTVEQLKAMLRGGERRKVIVFKFGGTTAGSNKQDARLRDARLLIEQRLNEGYFVVPVFSAYKRLGEGRQRKVGITDLLLEYREVIGSKETEREGVKEFRRQLVEPHLELLRDLGIIDRNTSDEDLRKASFKSTGKFFEDFQREINAIVGDAATFNKFIPGQGAIDHLVAGGERLMVKIVAEYFNRKWREAGFAWRAVPATARDVGVLTDNRFGDANILDDSLKLIYSLTNKFRKRQEVPILTGFDGIFKTVDSAGRERRYTTTLGRSGSDLTATYVGYAMMAEATCLVKDTDGVLTADPRYVPDARTIDYLSYDLAVEAGNIMTKAVKPAMDGQMDLIVMNPKNPAVFTRIGPEVRRTGPVLITNPDRCRYVRVNMGDSLSFSKLYEELRRTNPTLFELYHTGEHVSFIIKGTKLPRSFVDYLMALKGVEIIDTPAWFFQVVGYMSREHIQRFNEYLDTLQQLSGPRWFEGSKSMNVCLREEGTDIGGVLREIHERFVK